MNVLEMGASVPTNWKSQIEQVVRGYETEPARGLIHGLQKDFVQNSWGHRVNKKGTSWGMNFELIANLNGTFLLIEDWGTTGMTGPNLSMKEISKLSSNLDPDYKLARFSAMNYSGGNEGAGLFGRGKTLFSAASKDIYYIFESLTPEEGYRTNWKKLIGNDLKVGEKALEGQDGKDFIVNQTGIEPISRVGSRIIIVNPIDELIQAINSGEFIKNIEETWWRIILKFSANITVKDEHGKIFKASLPAEYVKIFNSLEAKKWYVKNENVPNYYSVKNLGLFVSEEDIDEELRGIYIYRKDMKVGEISLDIPSKIKNKYFGFIEVDSEWEEELAKIEDVEHYDFGKKRTSCYQNIKNFTNSEHDKFMEELGLIKRKRSDDQVLLEELMDVSKDLDSFLTQFNLDNVSSGKNKKETIQVAWAGIEFPAGKKDEVVTGDIIQNIKFKVKNNSGGPRKVIYKLSVFNRKREVLLIESNSVRIVGSEEITFGPFCLEVKAPVVRYEKNIITLDIIVEGTQKIIKKEIPFYYDTAPESYNGRQFLLQNISIEMPSNDSKRINSDESIKKIRYEIKNETSEVAYLAFSLSTHDGNEGHKNLIEQVCLIRDIVVKPHDSIEIECPDIYFSKEVYESKILKGPIEIRTRLSASQDFGPYETTELVCKNAPIIIFFNEDGNPVSQTFSDTTMIESDERRSDVYGSKGNWGFAIYTKHPAYQRVIYEEDDRKEYITEEMLKQMVRVHLKEGNYSILSLLNVDNNELDDDIEGGDLLDKVYLVIDKLQLQRYQGSVI